MSSFEVIGGHPLQGEIMPQGAKNEALQILCAVLLTDEVVTISNVPNIVDVQRLLSLLKGLGVKIVQQSEDTYTFQADEIKLDFFESEDFRKNATRIRGSVMLLGPLLGRYQRAFLPQPGGDKIGRRRMDTHFNGLEKLGATFTFDTDKQVYNIRTKGLKGTYIWMDEISVTGTANVVMAAVMAEGTTTIYNAACEPYL